MTKLFASASLYLSRLLIFFACLMFPFSSFASDKCGVSFVERRTQGIPTLEMNTNDFQRDGKLRSGLIELYGKALFERSPPQFNSFHPFSENKGIRFPATGDFISGNKVKKHQTSGKKEAKRNGGANGRRGGSSCCVRSSFSRPLKE